MSKYADFSNARLKDRIEELVSETEPFSSVEHLKYLDFFQAGLEYERRLVEEEEREQKITLYDGVIVSSNTVTTVRFKTDEILMLMVDSPIQIQFPDSKQLEATYIGQDAVNMTVDLTVEGVVPGHLLDRVTILSSSSALLKRLSRRFLEWENGELDREPNHAPTLLNGTFFKPVISSNYSFPELLTLNPEQEDALSRTVDPGIVLLWGPPGTGKTTVLSLSIVNALEQNKRLLLASNTNKAIDHALNKVIDHIENNPQLFPNAYRQLNEDLLLRFREIRTDDVYDKLNPRVSLKAIANRKAGGILDQIESIRRNLRDIEEQLRMAGATLYELQDIKWNLENFDSYKKEVEEVREKAMKLEEERKAVLEMIDKIEVKKLNVFMECFNHVSAKFSELYYNFFEGEGKLELGDSLNPLEGGLLIQAKYKEDTLKSIDAMSGGEKSLTALAFLFAIQSFEPAPFYIFDEVDAALDKENSVKVGRMIKSISGKSQFISISHNDSVINQADQIIGVALNRHKSSVIGLKLPRGEYKSGAEEEAAAQP